MDEDVALGSPRVQNGLTPKTRRNIMKARYLPALLALSFMGACASRPPALPPWTFSQLDGAVVAKGIPGLTFSMAGDEAAAVRRIYAGVKAQRLYVAAEAPGVVGVYTVDAKSCTGSSGLSVPCSVHWLISYRRVGDGTRISVAAWEQILGEVARVTPDGYTDHTQTRIVSTERVVGPGGRHWKSVERLAEAINRAR